MASPLNNDDLDNINNALDAIKEARKVITRAKLAGIEVEEEATAMNTAETKLNAIKQGFFPSSK